MAQTYASGEEPCVGDVVQRIRGISAGVAPGDVIEVDHLSATQVNDGKAVRYIDDRHLPENLTLIARAGAPVAYQPGDVVEVVTPGSCEAGRGTSAGQRLTLTRIESPVGRSGRPLSPHGYGYSHEHGDSVRLHCCRLVHRPIKAITETTETTAPEKPADQSHPNWLQDVINVIEGRQARVCAPGKYRVHRENGRVVFEDLRPIEAGCPVTGDRAPGKIGVVKAIDPDTNEAWVRWRNPDNRRDYSTVNRADLRRAAQETPEKT